MRLSRNITVVINALMDHLVPPVLRDAPWFMALPMKLFAGKKAAVYMNFKERVLEMTEEEFARTYEDVSGIVGRETDLNEACVRRILSSVLGQSVLEAGCGKGALLNHLAPHYTVTGCDVVVDEKLRASHPVISFH